VAGVRRLTGIIRAACGVIEHLLDHAGTAWLRVEGQEPVQLMPGDLLLLPSGIAHRLSSEPDGRCRPFDRSMKEDLMTPDGDLELAGHGAVTTFVCAAYDYDLDVAQPLMGLLPHVLHVPADPVTGRRSSDSPARFM
jgi:hypothetical protein